MAIKNNVIWWGEFFIEPKQTKSWCFGERIIAIQRQASEWNIWNVEQTVESSSQLVIADDLSLEGLEQSSMSRHLQSQTKKSLIIAPALPDRSVVVRPAVPIRILGGESIKLYVSAPLWFTAKVGVDNPSFFEAPFWRPSDTWFGNSTIEGELCYSKYSNACIRLDAIDKRAHRAITPIHVVNRSSETLSFERFNLPMPMLNLYADGEGFLWTQALTVIRHEDDPVAEISVGKEAAPEALETHFVAGPRISLDRHIFTRALGHLFN